MIKIDSNEHLISEVKNKLEKKVLPCIKCGSENISFQIQWDCVGDEYWLACSDCYPDCKTPLCRNIDEVIKIWNKENME